MKFISYFHLARFHKPIGIYLLWSPTAWALWVSNQGSPPVKLVVLFLLGTVFMRAAGCIMNDIADRKIDGHVKRTQNRPLVTGELKLIQALFALAFFLFASLLILTQLPTSCVYYALLAVFVTLIYPFCKRFIQGPQLILGLAFSLGIPMAFAALGKPNQQSMYYLLLINYLWIVAYDTQYALADRKDDLALGVKSTAIWFAQYDRLIIGLLQCTFHLLWLLLAQLLNLSIIFYWIWGIGALILMYQHKLTSNYVEQRCMQAFSLNGWYGLLLWLALMMSIH